MTVVRKVVAEAAAAIAESNLTLTTLNTHTMRNTFGELFTLTTFGESHGPAIGGIVDGMPAGIAIDEDFIQHELDRRRPGQSALTTSRSEADRVTLLSGIFEGRSTGCPIGFVVNNANQHSADYDALQHIFRPSHADFTYRSKYGLRDHRGGGRASARVTISRVVGGALAKLALRTYGIEVRAFTQQVGAVAMPATYRDYDLSLSDLNAVHCPDAETAEAMERLILEVKADGDSIGGIIGCVVRGCPAGLGEPEFSKLHASLAAAMMSINAAKGFDYGAGFEGVTLRGSQQNDGFTAMPDGRIRTMQNCSGGIQGGISNGEDIYFRVAFKPVATIFREQQTVDTDGRPVAFLPKGRHDPCVLPRAIPIVEAMAAMTVLDHLLLDRCTSLS